MPAYIPNCIKLEIAKPMKIMLYILEPFTLPNSAIVYGKKIIKFDFSRCFDVGRLRLQSAEGLKWLSPRKQPICHTSSYMASYKKWLKCTT